MYPSMAYSVIRIHVCWVWYYVPKTRWRCTSCRSWIWIGGSWSLPASVVNQASSPGTSCPGYLPPENIKDGRIPITSKTNRTLYGIKKEFHYVQRSEFILQIRFQGVSPVSSETVNVAIYHRKLLREALSIQRSKRWTLNQYAFNQFSAYEYRTMLHTGFWITASTIWNWSKERNEKHRVGAKTT